MPQDISNEALLAGVAERDETALAELYDRFAPVLEGVLLRILSDREAASEVLEEVFLDLWKNARNLVHSGGSLSVWLVLLTRQEGIRRLRFEKGTSEPLPSADGAGEGSRRSKGREVQMQGGKARSDVLALKPPAPTIALLNLIRKMPQAWLPSPEAIELLEKRRPLILKVTGQLPEPQHKALELAVFGGYIEAEIAREMEEPLGKTRTDLRAAMTFLRHRLHALLGTWAANI